MVEMLSGGRPLWGGFGASASSPRDSPRIINNLLKSPTTTLTGLSKRMDTDVLVLKVSTSWIKK